MLLPLHRDLRGGWFFWIPYTTRHNYRRRSEGKVMGLPGTTDRARARSTDSVHKERKDIKPGALLNSPPTRGRQPGGSLRRAGTQHYSHANERS